MPKVALYIVRAKKTTFYDQLGVIGKPYTYVLEFVKVNKKILRLRRRNSWSLQRNEHPEHGGNLLLDLPGPVQVDSRLASGQDWVSPKVYFFVSTYN